MMDEERLEFVRMIRDSAGAVAPRDGTLDRIRALRFTRPGFDHDVWQQMGELGWIGLRLPETQGGVGLGMIESVALYEELGRGLVPEPLIAGSFAASLLAQTEGETELLAELVAGKINVAVAWADSADAMTAGKAGTDRCFVVAADAGGPILVPEADGRGIALRLLEAGDATIDSSEMQDGSWTSTVSVPDGTGRIVAHDVAPVFARALDEAALSTAAYLLGVAERAFEMTVAYLGERRQFGQPLGAFQALQHRCADIKTQLVLTRVSIEGAAADVDDNRKDAVTAVSRAKVRAADAALLVAREAVQMHGAIGYTDEYDVGLYVRKAMVLANAYGSASAHRRRFVALVDAVAA